MTADPYPNTPGMVDDVPAPAPRQGPRAMDAGMARQLYPDSQRRFVVTDPTAPQTVGEVLRARTGFDPYPNTPGMKGDAVAPAAGAPEASEEAKGEDGTPAAEDPTLAAYQVPLPENFAADPVAMTAFKTAALKHNLPTEAAGEFVRMHADALAAAERAQVDAEARTVAGWAEQAQRLPEWNEPGRAEAVAEVRKLVPASARALLDGPLGNHPGIVSLAVTLGRELRRLRGVGGTGLFANTPGMRP